jgi:hypothetical protein
MGRFAMAKRPLGMSFGSFDTPRRHILEAHATLRLTTVPEQCQTVNSKFCWQYCR